MLRRKRLMATKETPAPRPNAKVTVQYIQPQRQLSTNRSPTTQIVNPTFLHAEEIKEEDIEFIEDVAHGKDAFKNDVEASAVKVEDCEDVFYPNAIHCLLDLYKYKYENVVNNCTRIEKDTFNQVWHDIAKEMQESFFEFEAEQIQRKYFALRQQYFNMRNRNDLDNFEYFEQMHDIYKDPRIECLTKNSRLQKIATYIKYKDEDFVESEVCTVARTKQMDKSARVEIVHKGQGLIDVVEKELQSMYDDAKEEKENVEAQAPCGANSNVGPLPAERSKHNILKRLLMDKDSEEPVKQIPKIGEPSTENVSSAQNDIGATSDISSNIHPPDFTLFNYNEQQERRHREQLQLLHRQQNQQREQLHLMEKSIKLHERTLEQQFHLLQELIKRFPPT